MLCSHSSIGAEKEKKKKLKADPTTKRGRGAIESKVDMDGELFCLRGFFSFTMSHMS